MEKKNKAFSPDDRVRLDRIRLFFGRAAGNMVSIVLGAVLIVIVLRSGGAEWPPLIVWLTATSLLATAVGIYDARVHRTGLTRDNCTALINRRTLLGAFLGLLYGCSFLLLPAGARHHQDTFLFIILSTLVSVATLSYASMPRYYLTLDLVALAPLTGHFAVTWWTSADGYYLVLTTVAVAWQGVVLSKALGVSASVAESIALQGRLQDEIEEHKRTKELIRQLALHDALTGLANRRYFEESARRALKVAERDQARVGLITIDLNDFKPVNDTHGHAIGDRLLQAVAERLLHSLRASDFAARMGGDEFNVLAENVASAADLEEVARKLGAALDAPYGLGPVTVRVSASIGYALFPDDGRDLEGLLSVADAQMYQRKRARKAATPPPPLRVVGGR